MTSEWRRLRVGDDARGGEIFCLLVENVLHLQRWVSRSGDGSLLAIGLLKHYMIAGVSVKGLLIVQACSS